MAVNVASEVEKFTEWPIGPLSNLHKRLITAAIGIPLLLFGLFAFDSVLVPLILGAVAALALWECGGFLKTSQSDLLAIRALFVVTAAALYALLVTISTMMPELRYVDLLISVCLIALPTILFWMFWRRLSNSPSFKSPSREKLNDRTKYLLVTGCSLLIVGVCANLQMLQTKYGVVLLLAVVVIAWLTDTGAYAVGKMLGKRPMAKIISPNKTIEGLCGGYLFGFISVMLLGFVWFMPKLDWSLVGIVLLALVLPLLAIVGDLIESAYKRAFVADDSGGLLPGHGGLLDRLDSTIYVAPSLLACSAWYAGSSV